MEEVKFIYLRAYRNNDVLFIKVREEVHHSLFNVLCDLDFIMYPTSSLSWSINIDKERSYLIEHELEVIEFKIQNIQYERQ